MHGVKSSENDANQPPRESDEILKPLLKPQVKSILIKGEPGTGKTTLAMELLRIYGSGIYVSTRLSKEQSKDHHPELSYLFETGSAIEINAQDYDLKLGASYSFEDLRFSGPGDIASVVIKAVQKVKRPMIVLDSWDAIANRTEKTERLKVEQSLSLIALGNNARLIFVSEEPGLTTTDYLVDAIVTLHNDLYEGRRLRSAQWSKIRGSAMSNWSNLFTLYEGRFTAFPQQALMWQEVANPRPFTPLPHKDGFYSTGSADLDAFLGGGMRKTFFVLIEFGKYVGSTVFNPISTSIRCNFVMNDGCTMTIPSPRASARRLKDSVARHVPKEVIDSSMRLAYFQLYETDPCFILLNSSSSKECLDKILDEAKKIKGSTNRPCAFSLGDESLEKVFSNETSDFISGLLQRVRHLGDVLYVVMRHDSPLENELSYMSDVHVKFDQIDGTVVVQRLKPWSELYAVKTDYTKGYPDIRLTPFV